MMPALVEQQHYGLSTCPSAWGRVSVLHVKLTESALRSVEEHQRCWGPRGQPSIRFAGNQGRICIPRRDRPGDVQRFTFYLSRVGRDNPQGTFECIRQYVTCDGNIQLEYVGGIQDKVTICATDDSYQKAQQSVTLAKEDMRSRGAIFITPEKHMWTRKPVPGQRSMRMRPLRERLTHLLALKPYQKPELMLRLQEDGMSAQDRHALDGLLQEVATLNRDYTFTLKDTFFKELHRDWPGYSERDRYLLHRILFRKSGHSQNAPPTHGIYFPAPRKDHISHFQKRPNEIFNPLASKKPRKSQLASIGERPIDSKLGESNRVEGRGVQMVDRGTVSHLPTQGITRSLHPLSDVSNDSAHSRKDHKDPDAPVAERLWHLTSGSIYQSPSTRGSGPPLPRSDQNGTHQSPTELLAVLEESSYLQKYTAVCSQEQRRKYKNDFDVEYGEYRRLHAHIASITCRFSELDSQLRRLQPGTSQHRMIHNQILQEYHSIKEMNPTYSQEKSRCEFLHRKLAHIKKLIAEFDQRQPKGSS